MELRDSGGASVSPSFAGATAIDGGRLKAVVSLMRVGQWVKNAFVFVPMFLAGSIGNIHSWLDMAVTLFAFCLTSSAVYCFNDIMDVKEDAIHPEKCKRPLVTGIIRPGEAIVIIFVLLSLVAAGCALLLQDSVSYVVLIIGGYMLMNVAYSMALKKIPVLDVFVIALGFVLRLLAGGVACNVSISPWFVGITFLIALFMAFAKRRDDLVIYERFRIRTRQSVAAYTLSFVNMVLVMLSSLIMVCYLMWSMSEEVVAAPGGSWVYTSSIFVLAGLLRYLYIAMVEQHTGSPTRIVMSDAFLQSCIFFWAVELFILVYLAG